MTVVVKNQSDWGAARRGDLVRMGRGQTWNGQDFTRGKSINRANKIYHVGIWVDWYVSGALGWYDPMYVQVDRSE